MQQGTVETGDRGLLATVLGGGGRENATDLTDESPTEPEWPCLVQKVPHLRAHVAESGWRAEDNGIGFDKLARRGNWDVPEGGARCLSADLFQRLLGHEFGDLIQADFGAFNFARSFHYRLGHAIDVPEHAVKHYLNLHAHCRFLTYSNKLPAAHGCKTSQLTCRRVCNFYTTSNSCIAYSATTAFLLPSSFG